MPRVPVPSRNPLLDIPLLGRVLGFLEPELDPSSVIQPLSPLVTRSSGVLERLAVKGLGRVRSGLSKLRGPKPDIEKILGPRGAGGAGTFKEAMRMSISPEMLDFPQVADVIRTPRNIRLSKALGKIPGSPGEESVGFEAAQRILESIPGEGIDIFAGLNPRSQRDLAQAIRQNPALEGQLVRVKRLIQGVERAPHGEEIGTAFDFMVELFEDSMDSLSGSLSASGVPPGSTDVIMNHLARLAGLEGF